MIVSVLIENDNLHKERRRTAVHRHIFSANCLLLLVIGIGRGTAYCRLPLGGWYEGLGFIFHLTSSTEHWARWTTSWLTLPNFFTSLSLSPRDPRTIKS